jgi:hypothetical protein
MKDGIGIFRSVEDDCASLLLFDDKTDAILFERTVRSLVDKNALISLMSDCLD